MEQKENFRVAMLSLHSCPLDVPGRRDTGGMNVYVQQVSRCLGELGIMVDIFTHSHSPALPETEALGVSVRLIHLPVDYEGGKLGLYQHLPDFTRAINHFAKQEGISYQLVHSHYWLSGLVGAGLASQWGVPHIIMLHTSARAKNYYLGTATEIELRGEVEEKILGSADLVLASTIREKEDLKRMYGVEGEKIVVIPCGVDLEMFRPYPKALARQSLGLNGAPLVLYVGRIEPGKGIELLLEATALSWGQRHCRLMMVGGGESEKIELERLRRLGQRLGIAERVDLCGAVAQERLPLFYSAADVCVLPSRYETFGMVVLEALACGTPVIASRVGTMEDIIQPGKNGFLLDELSPEGIAFWQQCLLEDTALKEKLSCLSRNTVAEFDWPGVAQQIAREYYRLIRNHKFKIRTTKQIPMTKIQNLKRLQ